MCYGKSKRSLESKSCKDKSMVEAEFVNSENESKENDHKSKRLKSATIPDLDEEELTEHERTVEQVLNNIQNSKNATSVDSLVENLKRDAAAKTMALLLQVGEGKGDFETLESTRAAYDVLRKDNEKKENLIQDLLKKLQDALETIQKQSCQIKGLQAKVQEEKSNGSAPSLPKCDSKVSPERPIKVESAPEISPPPLKLHLKIIQQPPSQAIYQRILRPFPTVAVMGASSKSYANYFVEVSLLKQSLSEEGNNYSCVTWYKNGGSPLEGDKEKNLIGGQLVQRSEPGSTPDSLVVVFRRLKILTTSTQQGAFFVLKFCLKRYVDNQFETVPNVPPVISNPIEIFSHTLYLKHKPLKEPFLKQIRYPYEAVVHSIISDLGGLNDEKEKPGLKASEEGIKA